MQQGILALQTRLNKAIFMAQTEEEQMFSAHVYLTHFSWGWIYPQHEMNTNRRFFETKSSFLLTFGRKPSEMLNLSQ